MNYQRKSFSVPVGSQEFRDGWERVFGIGCDSVHPSGRNCQKRGPHAVHVHKIDSVTVLTWR